MTGSSFEYSKYHEDRIRYRYEPPEALFGVLQYFEPPELRAFGLSLWSENSGLWLFPHEWYEHIPDGFVCTKITGGEFAFSPDEADKDNRYGALAYGIVRVDS